jgi:hypothetical protein
MFITKMKPRKYGLEGFFPDSGAGFRSRQVIGSNPSVGGERGPHPLFNSLFLRNKLSGPKNLMVPSASHCRQLFIERNGET